MSTLQFNYVLSQTFKGVQNKFYKKLAYKLKTVIIQVNNT